MRTPRVYLETSVFNFVFADNDPEKQHGALKLFEEIGQTLYKPYSSDYVLHELSAAQEPKRGNMLRLLEKYSLNILPTNPEAERLAEIYVSEGIIPAKFSTDAVHIACATVNDLDFIVSYNFRHIVKRKTIIMTGAVNLREGYKQIGIFSPLEVIENE